MSFSKHSEQMVGLLFTVTNAIVSITASGFNFTLPFKTVSRVNCAYSLLVKSSDVGKTIGLMKLVTECGSTAHLLVQTSTS